MYKLSKPFSPGSEPPSTYVYTSFVSDLVLAKSIAVGNTPRQALLFDHSLYWLHIAWARYHYYETESIT